MLFKLFPAVRFIPAILLFIIPSGVKVQENTASNIKKAQACFARLDEENQYRDNPNHVDMNILPSGISQTAGNMGVTLAVHSAEFFPEYTSLGIFLRLDVPNREEPLLFGAEGIKLFHDANAFAITNLDNTCATHNYDF